MHVTTYPLILEIAERDRWKKRSNEQPPKQKRVRLAVLAASSKMYIPLSARHSATLAQYSKSKIGFHSPRGCYVMQSYLWLPKYPIRCYSEWLRSTPDFFWDDGGIDRQCYWSSNEDDQICRIRGWRYVEFACPKKRLHCVVHKNQGRLYAVHPLNDAQAANPIGWGALNSSTFEGNHLVLRDPTRSCRGTAWL